HDVDLVPVHRTGGGDSVLQGQAGEELHAGTATLTVDLRHPGAVVLLDGDFAATSPDPRHDRVLGISRDREGGHVLLVLGQVDGDVAELVPVLGDVVSVFFEDVGAVDDRADRRVPGQCVDLVVDLPHLEHAFGVGRGVVDVRGQVVQCPGIGELGGEGGAQLDDVGHGSTGDRCGDLVLGVRPGDELHIDVDTVFFGESGVGRIEEPCFVRVRAFHD